MQKLDGTCCNACVATRRPAAVLVHMGENVNVLILFFSVVESVTLQNIKTLIFMIRK